MDWSLIVMLYIWLVATIAVVRRIFFKLTRRSENIFILLVLIGIIILGLVQPL